MSKVQFLNELKVCLKITQKSSINHSKIKWEVLLETWATVNKTKTLSRKEIRDCNKNFKHETIRILCNKRDREIYNNNLIEFFIYL